ncbi:MAG: hypothetical protein ACC707_05465, partial [Thiohalomonadales bacterium]
MAMNKIFKIVAIFSISIIVIACSTSRMNSSNYREKIQIKHLNSKFYSAEYIGLAPNICFPPITNMICKKLDKTALVAIPKHSKSYRSIKEKIG